MARRTWSGIFFGGAAAVSTSSVWYSPWKHTATTGSPTCVFGVDSGTSSGFGGYARMAHSSATQIENGTLSFGDVLQFGITQRLVIEGRVRLGQSALDTATSLVFGMAGDRNSTLDSVAQHAWFRMEGGTSTTAVVYESDDGTTDTDDQSTSLTLTTGWKSWKIDMTDLTKVKFHLSDAGGTLVRLPVTTNMSAYAGALQPFIQLQKTSDNNVDAIELAQFDVTYDLP